MGMLSSHSTRLRVNSASSLALSARQDTVEFTRTFGERLCSDGVYVSLIIRGHSPHVATRLCQLGALGEIDVVDLSTACTSAKAYGLASRLVTVVGIALDAAVVQGNGLLSNTGPFRGWRAALQAQAF